MDNPATPDTETLPQATEAAAPIVERPVISENDFETVVNGALEAVDGTLLFKMQVGPSDTGEHVAAAAVGNGESRQFLLLTLPASGGKLKVETVSASVSPLAGIAESYAGLMDVLKAAA